MNDDKFISKLARDIYDAGYELNKRSFDELSIEERSQYYAKAIVLSSWYNITNKLKEDNYNKEK